MFSNFQLDSPYRIKNDDNIKRQWFLGDLALVHANFYDARMTPSADMSRNLIDGLHMTVFEVFGTNDRRAKYANFDDDSLHWKQINKPETIFKKMWSKLRKCEKLINVGL